ncbi:hypothetical protein ADL01_35120 [Streptomyces sp. NRRL WC-3618]|nr:hypothetical protein ADL01_35120 [Streptomyces sp. NRRL WC-3618]
MGGSLLQQRTHDVDLSTANLVGAARPTDRQSRSLHLGKRVLVQIAGGGNFPEVAPFAGQDMGPVGSAAHCMARVSGESSGAILVCPSDGHTLQSEGRSSLACLLIRDIDVHRSDSLRQLRDLTLP